MSGGAYLRILSPHRHPPQLAQCRSSAASMPARAISFCDGAIRKLSAGASGGSKSFRHNPTICSLQTSCRFEAFQLRRDAVKSPKIKDSDASGIVGLAPGAPTLRNGAAKRSYRQARYFIRRGVQALALEYERPVAAFPEQGAGA